MDKISQELQKMMVVGGVIALGTAVVRYSPLTVAPVGTFMIGWGLARLTRQLTGRPA